MWRQDWVKTILFGLTLMQAGLSPGEAPAAFGQDSPLSGAIRIRADIDGRTQLHLRDDTLHWFHMDHAAPGRDAGNDLPTYVNGAPWQPLWPQPGRNDWARCDSSKFREVVPPLPLSPVKVGLMVWRARESVKIIQQPSAENDHTLIVEFDDNRPGGSDWYDVTIVWPPPEIHWSPPPPAIVTMEICLFDVILPESGPSTVDLSPDGLGLDHDSIVRPGGLPSGVESPVVVAHISSIEDGLRSLEKQGSVRLRASNRASAQMGQPATLDVRRQKPGDISMSVLADVRAAEAEQGLLALNLWAVASPTADVPRAANLRYYHARAASYKAMANDITSFPIRNGDTAFLRLNRPSGVGERIETVMLVKLSIADGDE